MSERIPIVGVAGGIGAGKSFVAKLLAEEAGGVVHDADQVAKAQLDMPEVRKQIVDRFGPDLINADGMIDRKQLASIVFADPRQKRWLEGVIHPRVADDRRLFIQQVRQNDEVALIVLDVPLLFEAGIDTECDAVLFVEADRAVRLRRVARTRGWDEAELLRREKNQWPLDKKRDLSDHVLRNDRDEGATRQQIRQILPRILRMH